MDSSHQVTIKPAEFQENLEGDPHGTGFPVKTLIMATVAIDLGAHTSLHRHNCEEVYYVHVLQGPRVC